VLSLGRMASWCLAVPSLATVPPHSVKCTPAWCWVGVWGRVGA
jgi:hypothetical protein